MRRNIQIFLETFALNAIIFAFFFLFNPQQAQFLEMNVHPFLILCIFVGIRYGSYFGGFCATIASCLYLLAYTLLGRDLLLLFIEFSYYKYILMFYLSAVILGYYKDTIVQKIQDLRHNLNQLQRNYDRLRQNYKKTLLVKNELKKQIIGTEESILALYEMASSLESIDSEEIYTEVMGVLVKYLKAKRVSIYMSNEYQSYLRLKVRFGSDSALPNSIKVSDSRVFSEVVKSKKAAHRQADNNTDPVFIAPLIQNDEIIGVINIEDCDFEIITDYTFNLFKIIVDWTTKSLVRALSIESSEKTKFYYQNTRIMKYDRFTKRLAEEKKRQSKYGLEYILLSFTTQSLTVNKINESLNGSLREVDVVSFDDKSKQLHFLFPVSPHSAKADLEERLLANFENKIKLAK